jgi:hypothetical protein
VNVLPPEVRILLGKELRQVRRSRGALASATLLPLFFITVLPLTQVVLCALRWLTIERYLAKVRPWQHPR